MDYCTFWFDRLLWWDWSSCCADHDLAYDLGMPKGIADGLLSICVDGVLPGMGSLMWTGVASLIGWAFYFSAQLTRIRSK